MTHPQPWPHTRFPPELLKLFADRVDLWEMRARRLLTVVPLAVLGWAATPCTPEPRMAYRVGARAFPEKPPG